MSRPIPEGRDIPETCKMLCVGASGDKCFNCGREEGDFCPEYRQAITERDSEVARLNYLEIPDSSPRPMTYESADEMRRDQKDALIRELVGALEEIRKPDELVEANDAFAIHALRRIQAQAQHALILARTTCPEAFES